MIRDPGPIHSLGSGVTTRDVPLNEGETSGVAPNSGYVSRAVNGHPIMRFFASTAAVMVGAAAASAITKKGGIKLAKFVQDKADEALSANIDSFSTRLVKSATDIRRQLDELQGVKRAAGDGGEDPYSKLVFEIDGKLGTGYSGAKSERFGYDFLTGEERRQSALANFNEPAAVWSLRDNIQQRLVRAGRRMPYELPAMYATQRGLVDPLMGEDESRKKVKWYNPADVVADFTKQSITNMATMILPFEFAGAAANSGRSSLHALKYSNADLRRLTGFKQKMHKSYIDVSEVLSEVGHDLAGITDKFLRGAAQSSGALSAATEAYKNNQQGFVQTLSQLRHGRAAAIRNASNTQASQQQIRNAGISALFKGYQDGNKQYSSMFDLIPSFRGLRSGFVAGSNEFKRTGLAYDAMENSVAFNRVLTQANGMFTNGDDLLNSINKIQSAHASRFSRLAEGIRVMGGGGPNSRGYSTGAFASGQRADAFKDLLQQNLISAGASVKQADDFVQYLKIDVPKSGSDATQIIQIGKTRIYGAGTTADEISEDFFTSVLKRYRGVKGGTEFKDVITPNALKRSVEDAQSAYLSADFQKALNNKIKNNWNAFNRKDLSEIGSVFLSPKKALYQDFVGVNSLGVNQKQFLQRKTAEVLGVPLKKANGQFVADDVVRGALKNQGFDPNNFGDLRAFLIRNKQMTSGVMSGEYNLFGLKSVTVDEATKRGVFRGMRPEEQKIINDLAARMAINDPVSKSIGFSKVDGLYQTASGKMLDFSAVKGTFSRLANFAASEFKIPILGFNPTDLFGGRSFREMANKSPLQYVSSRDVQPFLKGTGESRADFYMWYKTAGTKGKLISYRTDGLSGAVFSSTMNGTYRALPSNSVDLLTRQARNAANAEGETINQITGQSGSRFLDRVLGNSERAIRFKKRMSIDSEQPNSLFGVLDRFTRRAYDPNNPAVMGKLLRGETVQYGKGGSKRNARLGFNSDGQLRLLDADDVTRVVGSSEEELLSAYDAFRRNAFQYGVPAQVMREAEAMRPDLFTYLGKTVGRMESQAELLQFADEIIAANPAMVNAFRRAGLEADVPLKSISRIKKLVNEGNLSKISASFDKSPTINSRLDELKNEIFRYISQTNPALKSGAGAAGGDDFFQGLLSVQQATDKLLKQGIISSSQRAEANAAALSTLFNISAFKTFQSGMTTTQNARAAVAQMQQVVKSIPEFNKFFDPYVRGEISQVGSVIKKRFSNVLAPSKRKFGIAPYSIDDLAVDPLGTGGVTIVPTFGTAYANNPGAAVKSVLGINTFSNPEGYSGASVPVAHAVDRLNRYFGTLGMQLDVSDFKGPLDMFARGMIGKRVLPLYAAGTTALTVDRTLGGMVNGEDANGERVYSPLIMGEVAKAGVELSALTAGLTPGGMSYDEKKEQLVDGEVPIRQGRFWPLGNTPFEGGKVMYYRPSWYKRLQGGAMFTSDTYGSPMEKFLFYNDISPLRPLDPYRFERKHYEDRPYPVTGEYFSGPFGPLTPIMNATIGKILKPQLMMHEEQVAAGLAEYARVGTSGAYSTAGYGAAIGGTGFSAPGAFVGGNIGFGRGAAGPTGISSYNQQMAAAAGGSRNTAATIVAGNISGVNQGYLSAASYGPPKVSGVMTPNIIGAGTPMDPASFSYQGGEIGYRLQEMAGIYGFGFASVREAFGFGQKDFEPQRSVLQSASKAYGTSRAFWDLNLGGLGDVPLPSTEGVGNLEFSEIVRRFIPKDRKNVDYLNPIKNTMGMQYPFLPGAEYFTDFTTGDPFTKVQEGELRLPGIGYERFNKLYSDETGRYGALTQLDILADVAPYSKQFKMLNKSIDSKISSPEERIKLQQIRDQVAMTTKKYEFQDYKYKGSSAGEMGMNQLQYRAGRLGEYIAHSDNFIVNKFMGKRTAVEDWERRNVYGSTFPEWSRPYESYIKPMIDKATQRDPIQAGATLAAVGALFGSTPRARFVGAAAGLITGTTASLVGNVTEAVTGERFIPERRKKELALEEYTDILSYVKNTRLASQAQAAGDSRAAVQFRMAAKRTMYGADLYSGDVDSLALALPKRKREHFKEMLNAPVEDRERILSTAGRLERRIYEAAWGMKVEKRPELSDYFERHELPDASWEGWHPNTNIDHVKIKMGQSMGIEMSQMGYYPQQIRQANLANPSYPDFFTGSGQSTIQKIRQMISNLGINGSVTPVMNPFGSESLDVYAGVG